MPVWSDQPRDDPAPCREDDDGLFEVTVRDGRARLGKLHTAHGILDTPTLLPVINPNIRTIEPLNADILSARAFSELKELIEISYHHRKERGVCLFLKGENYRHELDKTLNYWFFDYDVVDSHSNSSGNIIRVKNIFKR